MNIPMTTIVTSPIKQELPAAIIPAIVPVSWNWKLILVVVTTCVYNLGIGAVVGYSSPALPDINANRNPFHISYDDQSWIGSMVGLGTGIAGLFTGTSSDLLGRKLAMMTSGLFVVMSYIIIVSAINVRFLYAGMFLSSFFALINASASYLYIAEVAPGEIRGTCVSLTMLAYSIGIVISYVLGMAFHWNWLAILLSLLYTIPNLVLVFLPESPRWFLLKGNRDAAVHGLQWFIGAGREAVVAKEIREMEESLPADKIKICFDFTSFYELFANAINRMSILVCVMLFMFQVFCGNIVLQVFTVTIFQLSGSMTTDANVPAIITGMFSVLGGIICPLLVERVGRRVLMIVSTIIVCASMAVTGVFFRILETNPTYAQENLGWLPVVGLSVGNLGFAIGLLPVPVILSCEMFPTNVRGSAQTVTMFMQGIGNFACAKTFLNIQNGIGTSGAFFFYAAVCAFGTLFSLIFIKTPKSTNIG